jgi:hypothetical protein
MPHFSADDGTGLAYHVFGESISPLGGPGRPAAHSAGIGELHLSFDELPG